MGKYTIAVGWTLADEVSDGGKAAFIPSVKLVDATGAAISFGTGGLPTTLGQKTMAGSTSVTIASDQSALTVAGPGASLAARVGNPEVVAGTFNTSQPTATNGQAIDLQTNNRGALQVVLTSAGTLLAYTGSADGTAGVNALDVAAYSRVWNGATWDRLAKPSATSRLLSSAATTNATGVKASAGNIFRINGNNTAASKRYLKLYNKASAPTVGTDTPVMTLVLLASSGFDFSIPPGIYFGTGIAYAITGAAADADTTAIVAGDIECLNILYS